MSPGWDAPSMAYRVLPIAATASPCRGAGRFGRLDQVELDAVVLALLVFLTGAGIVDVVTARRLAEQAVELHVSPAGAGPSGRCRAIA